MSIDEIRAAAAEVRRLGRHGQWEDMELEEHELFGSVLASIADGAADPAALARAALETGWHPVPRPVS